MFNINNNYFRYGYASSDNINMIGIINNNNFNDGHSNNRNIGNGRKPIDKNIIFRIDHAQYGIFRDDNSIIIYKRIFLMFFLKDIKKNEVENSSDSISIDHTSVRV